MNAILEFLDELTVIGFMVAVLLLCIVGWRSADSENKKFQRAKEDTPDPYDIGFLAAKCGAEFWETPHASPSSRPRSFNRWFAGWCHGQQILQRMES